MPDMQTTSGTRLTEKSVEPSFTRAPSVSACGSLPSSVSPIFTPNFELRSLMLRPVLEAENSACVRLSDLSEEMQMSAASSLRPTVKEVLVAVGKRSLTVSSASLEGYESSQRTIPGGRQPQPLVGRVG